MFHLATLTIDGQSRRILESRVAFTQILDMVNKPAFRVILKPFEVTIVGSLNNTLYTTWHYGEDVMKDGEIRFENPNGVSRSLTFAFANAYLVKIKTHYRMGIPDPLRLHLTISAGVINYRGRIVEKSWNPSNPFTFVPDHVIDMNTLGQKQDVLIRGVKWADECQQRIKSASYGEKVSLYAEVQGLEGKEELVSLTLEKEDKSAFEDQVKQISYEATTDSEGIVTFEDIELKESWGEASPENLKLIGTVSCKGMKKKSEVLTLSHPTVLDAYFAKATVEEVEVVVKKSSGANTNKVYTIKKGDSISKIAGEKGTTVAKILECNDTLTQENKNDIVPGQKITLPKDVTATEKKKKITFEKTSSLSLEADAFIIVETKGLQDRSVAINVKQGKADGMEKKDEAVTLKDDQGRYHRKLTTTVGGMSKTDYTNKDDYDNYAIYKFALDTDNKKQKEAWKEALENNNNQTHLYLLVDAHSDSEKYNSPRN